MTEVSSETAVTTEAPVVTDTSKPEDKNAIVASAADAAATTESTDGDEGDVTSSDGKLDVAEVNKIVQRRVARAQRKAEEAAEAKAAEEIEFWRGKAAAQVQTSAPTDVLPPKPKMTDYASNPTQFETDLEKWTQLKSNQDNYQTQTLAAYQRKAMEFAAKTPDYEKSVQFFNSVNVPKSLQTIIIESDVGPQLSYYLSKNFREFDRISKLSPVGQTRELAKLELKLTGQVTEPAVSTKPKPKPTTPVTGSAPAGTPSANYTEMTKEQKAAFIASRKKAHSGMAIRR